MSTSSRWARFARVVGNTALTLAALGGLICIIMVPLALVFGVSLVMFKTGSMAPTIPAGSLSVVRQIPASEIRVGEVVTVDRPAALPITHRVTSVSRGPSAAQRTITLKGDANASEDPAPYTVSKVRLTLFSVPQLAYVVVWFSNPLVLGALTLGLTALVTWAFWPHSTRHDRRRPPGGPRQSDAHDETSRRHQGASTAVQAVVLIAGVAATLVAVPAAPARAADTVTIVTGRYLTLTSIADLDRLTSMTPGTTVPWQVGVSANPPDPGTVTLAVSASGSAALQLTSQVSSCPTRWVDGVCSGGATLLQPTRTIPLDGSPRTLVTMRSAEQSWILFDVTRPSTATGVAPGQSVSMLFRASGVSDSVEVGPGRLATTGSSAQGPWSAALVSLGAIGVGLAITRIAFARRRRE